jgi:hypothetical protein
MRSASRLVNFQETLWKILFYRVVVVAVLFGSLAFFPPAFAKGGGGGGVGGKSNDSANRSAGQTQITPFLNGVVSAER